MKTAAPKSIFGTNAAGIAQPCRPGPETDQHEDRSQLQFEKQAGRELHVRTVRRQRKLRDMAGRFSRQRLPASPNAGFQFHFDSVVRRLSTKLACGMRRIGGNTFNGFNDPETGKDAQAFFPNYAGYPVMIGLGTGQGQLRRESTARRRHDGHVQRHHQSVDLQRLSELDKRQTRFQIRRRNPITDTASDMTPASPSPARLARTAAIRSSPQYRPRPSARTNMPGPGRQRRSRKQPKNAESAEFSGRIAHQRHAVLLHADRRRNWTHLRTTKRSLSAFATRIRTKRAPSSKTTGK